MPYSEQLFEVILDQVKSEDALTKKVSIDAVYALTAIIKEHIVPFRVQILTLLMPLRSHKVKPVREATIETIKILKETGPPIEDAQLALIEDRPRRGLTTGYKSPGRGAVTAPLTDRSQTATQTSD